MKWNSWRGMGSDGDILLTPYVPEGITGYDDDDDASYGWCHLQGSRSPGLPAHPLKMEPNGRSWNIGDYQSTLHKIPQERRSQTMEHGNEWKRWEVFPILRLCHMMTAISSNMSHEDCNIQQAKAAVKENHNKAVAGSNQTLGITQKRYSEAFHRLKFLTFQRLRPSFREKWHGKKRCGKGTSCCKVLYSEKKQSSQLS